MCETIQSHLLLAALLFPGCIHLIQTSSCNNTKTVVDGCAVQPFTYRRVFDKCVAPVKVGANWTKAEKKCVQLGGHLVKIESKQQDDSLIGGGMYYIWIGLRRTAAGGYRWISDGSEWKQGRDFGVIGNENLTGHKVYRNKKYDCVYKDNVDHQWKRIYCSRTLFYFCEEDSVSRPRRPNFVSRKVSTNGTVVKVGEKFAVTCRAHLGVRGELKFVIFNETDMKYITRDDTSVARVTEVSKVDTNGNCYSVGEAVLMLPVTRDLEGRTLACSSYRSPHHAITCGGGDKFCINITTFVHVENKTDDAGPDQGFCLWCWLVEISEVYNVLIISLLGLGLLFLFTTMISKEARGSMVSEDDITQSGNSVETVPVSPHGSEAASVVEDPANAHFVKNGAASEVAADVVPGLNQDAERFSRSTAGVKMSIQSNFGDLRIFGGPRTSTV